MWIRTTFYLIALLTRVGKIKCKFQTYLINNYMLNYGSFLKNYFYATLMKAVMNNQITGEKMVA